MAVAAEQDNLKLIGVVMGCPSSGARWNDASINGLRFETSQLMAAAKQGTSMVRRGDTLSRIAVRFGTSIEASTCPDLRGNADFIRVGQRLVVP